MIIKNVNRNKIHQEFVDAGIDIVSVFALDESHLGANVTFSNDVDMTLVQAIIDRHETTPPTQPISELDKIRIAQAEQFEYILEILGGM